MIVQTGASHPDGQGGEELHALTKGLVLLEDGCAQAPDEKTYCVDEFWKYAEGLPDLVATVCAKAPESSTCTTPNGTVRYREGQWSIRHIAAEVAHIFICGT